MTTRRERLEKKLDRRSDWAGSADREAERRFGTAQEIGSGIPCADPEGIE